MATADSIPVPPTSSPPMPTDLLVMVADMLPDHLEVLLGNLSAIFPPETTLIATENPVPAKANSSLRVVSGPPAKSGWSISAAEYLRAWQFVQENEPRAVLILGPGAESLAQQASLSLRMRSLQDRSIWPCRVTSFCPTPA